MFLPLDDNKNFERIAYLTHILIAVNVAVFLYISLPLINQPLVADGELFTHFANSIVKNGFSLDAKLVASSNQYMAFCFRYGYQPGEPLFSTLLGSMFLHSGWIHLGVNVLFLWIFGNNVECSEGPLTFLILYLGGGICATLFFSQFVTVPMKPFIGASGAVSAILASYFWLFPDNKVRVYIFLFPFIWNVFLLPACYFFGFYFLADNILPFISVDHSQNTVAHGAHIGGFLAGFLLIVLLTRHKKRIVRDGSHI